MFALRGPIIKVIQYIVLYLVIVALLFGLDSRGALRAVRTPIDGMVRPAVAGLSGFRHATAERLAAMAFSFEASKRELALERKYNSLLAQQVEINALQKENETLRNELQMKKPDDKPRLAGKLITTTDAMVLILDTQADVPLGTFVRQGNNVIGQVIAKRSTTIYEVMPTTHSSFKAKVNIIHEGKKVEGIAQGQFGTNIKITKILSSETVSPEDVVVVEDDEKPQAEGLVIGKVLQVQRKEVEVFQQAIVAPLYNLKDQNTVFLVL